MPSVTMMRPRPTTDRIGALVPRRVVRRRILAAPAPARRSGWLRGRWCRLPAVLILLAVGLAGDTFLTIRFGPPVPAPRGIGWASWYGPGFYGHRTAAGVLFTGGAMTAAHRSLPLGTRVRVTNLGNGKRAVVVIDDRGPYVGGRMIDLSPAAARRLGMLGAGVIKVRVDVLR